jgi:hypothetical protein
MQDRNLLRLVIFSAANLFTTKKGKSKNLKKSRKIVFEFCHRLDTTNYPSSIDFKATWKKKS